MLPSALQRIPFITLNTLCSYLASKAPNPPPNTHERDKFEKDPVTRDPVAKVVWWFGVTLRVLYLLLFYSIMIADSDS